MANKKVSRRALFTSIMSLILCCALLVGTTFAWFTDSVTSGLNTINSGNLDVELMADGKKVDANTKLFDAVELWEPGMVVYENLQVVNAGTLALKYQLSLNFGNENDLNGHKLSEVLKVALINKVDDGATRETVLADAKAAAGKGLGTLSNFVQEGSLEAGQKGTEQALVIYWDPDTSAVDNLYNANNGKITSDGQPLHIEFGVNLQATQMMNEKDSFGNDYDEFASNQPKATVNNVTAANSTINATMGIGGDAEPMHLDLALQFLPNETVDAATGELSSQYRYWHADYVVKADNVVPANSMALAGNYKEWCQHNNDNWVALTSSEDIPANTEIRLVEQMGVTVNYEEICRYGNDGIGFLCGAADLTGANAGTTITVELRLYETEAPSEDNGNSKNVETGYYEVVGTFTHTFGGSWINLEDGTELFSDENGLTLYDTQNVNAVNYTVPDGVVKLGNYSMTYNTNIQNVTLPASVRDLGRGFESNTTIKKVTLNEGLESISPRAFKGTTALVEVEIPSSVKVIEDNAFQKSGIKEITIPATVETIGETAFGASKIEKVTIEGNTSIQGYAFRGCPNLREVCLKGDDVTFIPSTLNVRNSTWFCNGESNNPNTSNITFYVVNETVAERVKTAMGAEADNTPVYVNGELYNG